MKFEAICSKENQKLTISIEATDVTEARDILHKQGYSIIEIRIVSTGEAEGNFFYFDIRVDGQIKSGQIQSNDIFKAYKKLVHDLHHDVVYIYSTKNMPEEQKKNITAKVKSGYELYIQRTKTKEETEDDLEEERNDIDSDVYNQISLETKKDIDKYLRIIDQVIEKIQNLLIKYNSSIDEEKKKKLEALQQALYQSKGSTNTGKLKVIAETSLLKIGEVELELVKLEVGEEKKKFFEKTNKLLKEVGSKTKFELKEDRPLPALVVKIQKLFRHIKQEIHAPVEATTPKSVEKGDQSSFGFYKNLRELKIYKNLLRKAEISIFKKMLHLEMDEVKRLFLKRKLIYQNIQIIESRVNNKNFSYTKIIRGADYYIQSLLNIVSYIGDIMLYGLLIYSLIFSIYLTVSKIGITVALRDNLSFFVAILSGFTFTTRFSANLLAFGGAMFFFLGFVWFLSINF